MGVSNMYVHKRVEVFVKSLPFVKSLSVCILVVLLISGIASADYVEKLNIFVSDAHNRGIPGADVWANYKINQIRGYVNTMVWETDPTGAQEIEFWYTEKDERKAVYAYTLYARYPGNDYDGPQAETSIELNAKQTIDGVMYYIQLADVYLAKIHVYDADTEEPIICNITMFEEQTEQTDDEGIAYFFVPKGSHEVHISIENITKVVLLNVSNSDTTLDVPIGIYGFNISVTDEFGNLLNSSLLISNSSFDIPGTRQIVLMTDEPIQQYSVLYEAREKKSEIDMATEDYAHISFDLSPPVINVSEIVEDERGISIKVSIHDEGIYASGVSLLKPPKLYYAITKPGTSKKGTITLAPSGDYFVARVPELLEGGLLEYEIDAYDNEDNLGMLMETYTGSYIAQQITNVTNGTIAPPQHEGVDTTTLAFIGMGIVIFIIILYYIKKRLFE